MEKDEREKEGRAGGRKEEIRERKVRKRYVVALHRKTCQCID